MAQKRFGVTSHFVASIALALLAVSSVVAQTQTKPSSTAVPAKPTNATTTSSVAPAPSSTAAALRGPKAFVGLATASNNNTVYFQGGQINANTVVYSGELFALDVTATWPLSNPAWTNLTIPSSGSSGPVVAGHSGTLSKDQSTLYVTAPSGVATNPFLYEYDIQAMTWSTQNAPAADAALWTNRKEAQLVTDPASGSLWYVGGSYPGGTGTNELDQFSSGTWNANVTTSPVLGQFSSGTAQLIGTKIYLFGGLGSTGGQRTYQSFQAIPYVDISTNPPTTGVQLTIGGFPSARQDHCSVYTASEKVLIYGGYNANTQTTLNDIWTLDMVTMTWQQVVTTNPTSARYSHSCNLVGANMIVHGGMIGTSSGYIGDIQVYDVMQSSWMLSYAPKQDTTPPSKPLSGGGSSSQGLSTGALVGIIVGVAVVLGAILGGIFYRRRQKRIEIREAQLEKEAYLASLGTDDPDDSSKRKAQQRGKHPYGSMASPNSTSTRHLNDGGYTAPNSPGDNHYAVGSPGRDQAVAGLEAGGPNIQYLMQQLPDGTIAVQPVYLDHQAMQSPGTYYGEATYPASASASPRVNAQGEGQAYFAPPPPTHNTSAAMNAYGQPIQSSPNSPIAQSFMTGGATPALGHGYVMPPTVPATPIVSPQGQWQIPMPPSSTHDPYASQSSGPSGSPLPPSASPRPPRSPRNQ
ncbi:hypothetical protein EMPS_02885 [Entomortierella parvispora]|uniref:Galactose oxidase n=1 Tax=Entomortierella parvispora TaxID=205924 RepID=A0A9P3H5J1_9FUNG|nr:hypothetical protein EMPS_02885 [Entomortierella parvispora]